MKIRKSIRCFLVGAGAFCVASARATEIRVDFAKPDSSYFLRLNDGSNGWTRPDWSQFFDDLNVSYRRMDHWNNAWNPVERRPDGGLVYNFGPLDAALRDSTGGFNFKPYPVLDYSPACLTTEFLQNPMRFESGKFRGCLTPAGTSSSGERGSRDGA